MATGDAKAKQPRNNAPLCFLRCVGNRSGSTHSAVLSLSDNHAAPCDFILLLKKSNACGDGKLSSYSLALKVSPQTTTTYRDIHTPPPFFLLPRSNYFNNLGTVFAQVYICGGFNGNECLFTAEVYNTESNQWTVIAPMRSRRSGIGVIAYGEHVYAVSLSWTTTKTITLDVLLPNRFTLPLVSI